ncbi:hypothetical protein C8Q80DRAFT_860613 [Daedaleopsis nitida]|nr:hypothetical protein C8Q80DRAFT_860613 [Daedaleopsis nitida]
MPTRTTRAMTSAAGPSMRSAAPVLPMDISQSPLLSSSLLPDELFATLAGPLPTITIFASPPPASPRTGAGTGRQGSPRHREQPRTKPLSTPSSPRLPAAQVASLLNLLEKMENDVAAEVQRVRLGIQETRWLVRACREDSVARETARQKRTERGGVVIL